MTDPNIHETGRGRGVWIFAEYDPAGVRNITLELLSEGQRLARRLDEPLCVCLLGTNLGDKISVLAQHGGEKVFLVANDVLAEYNLDAYSTVLCDLIEECRPSAFLLGATPVGSELAPRIAARLKLPCVTEVKKITGSRGNFQITKSMYNDQVYATVKSGEASPLVVTIPAGETDIVKSETPGEPEVIVKEWVEASAMSRTRIRKFLKGDPRTIKIGEAERIIAVGRGAGAEGLADLKRLADLLGASVGGSRGAVDAGLIPYERQIGISGKSVVPKLILACGISGARQFTVGMENSDLVIAVNLDEKARIFEYANLSIKGDLHQVIPAVIERLKNEGRRTLPASAAADSQ